MKYFIIIFASVIFPLMLPVESFAKQKNTEEKNVSVIVTNSYAFATASTAKNGAVFMTLMNQDNRGEDFLIKAESDVSEIVELHQNLIDQDTGKMLMRKVKRIALPYNEDTYLEPTGYHIMVIKLKKPLMVGEIFPVILHFEKSAAVKVEVEVVPPGMIPQTKHKDHEHSDH